MDFTLSEAQDELAGLARKILTDRDTPERQWADLAAAGVLAAGLPEALGGAGLGLLEHCSVLAEIGRAVADVPYLASIVLGAGAIAEFGSLAQQHRWVVPAGQGSVVLTAALAEEDGDDPRIPSASATRRNGRWLLSGVKTTVPAAPRADVFLVPASTADGVAVFLVEASEASVQPQRLTDFAEAGRVVLDGVTLDDDRVLGAPGQGGQVADWLVSRGTVGLCAAQAGVLERALELTAEYARNRVQFGRPIGSFQAVTQRLADAYIDTEAVRLTMWQAAWLLASGGEGDAGTAVATAKFWAADAGHRVAHTAVHVHGGLGIDMSYPVHRYFVAAKHHEFALGGATAQLRRIGADLRKLAR